MASEVTNYKCPACTAPLRFDGAAGKLQCDYCGASYDPAEIEKLYAEKDREAAEAFDKTEEKTADGWTAACGNDWGADADRLRVYACPSGAARYALDGGANVTAREDCFTHTTQVRTPIRTESGSKGGGGGGFHGGTTVNSGGYSHSGGKF